VLNRNILQKEDISVSPYPHPWQILTATNKIYFLNVQYSLRLVRTYLIVINAICFVFIIIYNTKTMYDQWKKWDLPHRNFFWTQNCLYYLYLFSSCTKNENYFISRSCLPASELSQKYQMVCISFLHSSFIFYRLFYLYVVLLFHVTIKPSYPYHL